MQILSKKNAEIRDTKMLKTNPLVARNNAVPYYQNLKEIPWLLKLENKKNFQKLVSFCLFVFVVPKHIAHKTAIKSNFVSQKAFI